MNDRQVMLEEQRELKRVQREMRELWLKVRAETGIVEYTDTRAAGWVRDVVEQLYRRESMTDIIAAVKSVARTPHSSPWKIRDECYRLASQRQREEHVARKSAEREIGTNLPAMPNMRMRR